MLYVDENIINDIMNIDSLLDCVSLVLVGHPPLPLAVSLFCYCYQADD